MMTARPQATCTTRILKRKHPLKVLNQANRLNQPVPSLNNGSSPQALGTRAPSSPAIKTSPIQTCLGVLLKAPKIAVEVMVPVGGAALTVHVTLGEGRLTCATIGPRRVLETTAVAAGSETLMEVAARVRGLTIAMVGATGVVGQTCREVVTEEEDATVGTGVMTGIGMTETVRSRSNGTVEMEKLVLGTVLKLRRKEAGIMIHRQGPGVITAVIGMRPRYRNAKQRLV